MNHPWQNSDDWTEEIEQSEQRTSWNGVWATERTSCHATIGTIEAIKEAEIAQLSKVDHCESAMAGTVVYQVPICRRPSKMIEIFPGVFVPLRGADETWSAIERDFYMPAVCLDCNKSIFCIEDAEFVLCPICRVVSPMEGGSASETNTQQGVGIGFTFEQLSRWQEEILQQGRRDQSKR